MPSGPRARYNLLERAINNKPFQSSDGRNPSRRRNRPWPRRRPADWRAAASLYGGPGGRRRAESCDSATARLALHKRTKCTCACARLLQHPLGRAGEGGKKRDKGQQSQNWSRMCVCCARVCASGGCSVLSRRRLGIGPTPGRPGARAISPKGDGRKTLSRASAAPPYGCD